MPLRTGTVRGPAVAISRCARRAIVLNSLLVFNATERNNSVLTMTNLQLDVADIRDIAKIRRNRITHWPSDRRTKRIKNCLISDE
jgi:hypothetical protein